MIWLNKRFGAGVHSVIEPAVYSNAVSFGPNYHILDEAITLVEEQLGSVIYRAAQFRDFLQLSNKEQELSKLSENTMAFTARYTGASQRIIQLIFGDA